MEEFKNVEKEYKILQTLIESESEDLSIIQSKLKSFQKNISFLKIEIMNNPDVNDSPFGFINQVFKNFGTNINKNLNEFHDIIGSPIENFISSLKYAIKKNINQFNEIINVLNEEKDILINKRDTYLNYKEEIKNNEQLIIKDENILNNAKKENYEQLYKYELNKMKEIIE